METEPTCSGNKNSIYAVGGDYDRKWNLNCLKYSDNYKNGKILFVKKKKTALVKIHDIHDNNKKRPPLYNLNIVKSGVKHH